MCSRVLFVGQGDLVITGRTMDWYTPTGSNLWAMPAGTTRDGATRENPFPWTATYGSLVTSMYDRATCDGVNVAGLAANLLYLSSSVYPERDPAIPGMCISVLVQYVLDSFATVAETVAVLGDAPFQVTTTTVPGGEAGTGHLSLSDRAGDSAIIEFLDGTVVIHHDPSYTVMTNDPPYAQQLALCAYFDEVGDGAFLPGTERPSDRFVRASHYLHRCMPTDDLATGVAQVFSITRNVSVPMVAPQGDEPNVAPTNWRTAIDHRTLTYYFESTAQPNVFWVEVPRLDLSVGAPVRRLEAEAGLGHTGDTSSLFEAATPFAYLTDAD
jgi:choloylglycine hydrolase